MKEPNSKSKQCVDLTDGRGNVMESAGSKEDRMKGFIRIMGAYCGKLKTAMMEKR